MPSEALAEEGRRACVTGGRQAQTLYVHELANHLFDFTIRVHDKVSAGIGKLRTVPVADMSCCQEANDRCASGPRRNDAAGAVLDDDAALGRDGDLGRSMQENIWMWFTPHDRRGAEHAALEERFHLEDLKAKGQSIRRGRRRDASRQCLERRDELPDTLNGAQVRPKL